MLLNIIFSFNRAMQLDYLLKSTIERFKSDYKIIVIYHTTGNHTKGYKKLIDTYSKYNHISFVERTPNQLSLKQKLTLNKIDKEKYLKTDNFKPLLENILLESNCKFVMFNTDDGFWFEDVLLDANVLKLINNNPINVSYRMYVGDNLNGFPTYVKKWNENYLWDYYYDDKITHWSYPFAVDGTIYSTKGILDIIKNVYYYNPVTLEGNVVNYVMKKKVLGIGLSPIKSKLIGTKLNRVAVETLNPTIHIKPENLNNYFLEDYELELQLPEKIDNSNIVPIAVNMVKGKEKINIYTLNEYGLEVQNNLGIEGAKKEME